MERTMSVKKFVLMSVAAAGLGASALALSATGASAYIACNDAGDCWHTDTRYSPPGVTFAYHPDDWYFHRHWGDDRYHWRDYHEGRGYYRGGVWVTL
jgi:hypothetical protein